MLCGILMLHRVMRRIYVELQEKFVNEEKFHHRSSSKHSKTQKYVHAACTSMSTYSFRTVSNHVRKNTRSSTAGFSWIRSLIWSTECHCSALKLTLRNRFSSILRFADAKLAIDDVFFVNLRFFGIPTILKIRM